MLCIDFTFGYGAALSLSKCTTGSLIVVVHGVFTVYGGDKAMRDYSVQAGCYVQDLQILLTAGIKLPHHFTTL